MKLVYTTLLILAIWLVQALVGGTRPVYCLPAYAILGLAGAFTVFSLRRPFPKPNLVCLWTSAIFFGYILVRAAFSPVDYLGWMDYFEVLACLTVYLLTALYISNSRLRVAVVVALLVLGLVEFFIGLRQFRFGDNWMPFGLVRSVGGSRASGMFISPIHLAGYLEVVGVLALSLAIWGSSKIWTRIAYGYMAVVCYAGVAITGSRGGYLSVAFSLCIFTIVSLWALRRTAPQRFAMAAILSIVGLVVFTGVGVVAIQQNEMLSERLSRLFGDKTGTRDVRFYNWQATLDQFRVSPVIGTGAGTHLYFGRLFRRPQVQADPEHAHSDYLELLAEYGIVGLAGIAVFLLVHTRAGIVAVAESTRTPGDGTGAPLDNRLALQIGTIAAISAYLAHSVTDFNLHVPGNALVFAFLFGIVANPHGRILEPSETGSGTRFFQLALPALAVWMLASGTPKYHAEYWTERARAALHYREFESAADFATRATREPTRNPYAHYLLARANTGLALTELDPVRRSDLHRASLSANENAIALFPNDVDALLHMGRTLDDLRRFRESTPLFERALALDPNRGSLRAYYARHLALVGREDQAKEQLQKARELGSAQDPAAIVKGTLLEGP